MTVNTVIATEARDDHAAETKPRRNWKEDPPLLLCLLKIVAAGIVMAASLVVGAWLCVVAAILYLAFSAAFITVVSLAFTPVCGFVALLLCIWFPVHLFTAD